MIKELYIDGYLVDIDDNFSIVRQLTSPLFSDVTQLKNNGSYSTKIPETQNNSFIMDYLEREDADTTFPYRGHVANYYVDSFPVFENAEVRVIDAFELQFVWGLNRGKYLPLFTRKLNEILPNGTTILESDWVVEWKKSNVVYNTGKKYKYLNYISGERESEVKIIEGETMPLTQAPAPFLSNLKEMTMHPFVEFSDMLDLIVNDATTQIAKEMAGNPSQNVVSFANVDGLKIGDLLVAMGSEPDLADFNIRITWINGLDVTFSEDVYQWYDEGFNAYFIQTNLASNVFDDLKPRLLNKGLILGGNKGNKTIECTISYVSETEFVEHVYTDMEGASVAYYIIPLTLFSSSFITNPTLDSFYWDEFVLGNMNDELEVHINLTTLSNYTRDLKLYSKKIYLVGGVGRSEIIEIQELAYTYVDPPGGYTYKRTYDTIVKLKKEVGVEYFIGGLGSFSSTIFVKAGGELKITHTTKESMFSLKVISPTVNTGYYDCLMNLPEITSAEFINQMLIMTGLFVGHDANGNMKFLSLDKFKANLLAGNIYDWSGKVSQKEKSYFQFNSNAQKNWIKFANSDDRTYTAKDHIPVDDTTLDSEKDLYTIGFDLAEKAASGIAEFILYKQKVTSSEKNVSGTPTEVKSFSQDYNEKPSVCVYDSSGTAIVENVLPNGTSGFVAAYYNVFKDIISRPRVLDIVVKLDFLETLNIDFEKPVYISDYGKYAVLLDIKIPDDGLCNAKILLINQTL